MSKFKYIMCNIFTFLKISSRAGLSVVNGKPEINSLVFSKFVLYLNLLTPKFNDLSSFLETNIGRPSMGVRSNLSAFSAWSFQH